MPATEHQKAYQRQKYATDQAYRERALMNSRLQREENKGLNIQRKPRGRPPAPEKPNETASVIRERIIGFHGRKICPTRIARLVGKSVGYVTKVLKAIS